MPTKLHVAFYVRHIERDNSHSSYQPLLLRHIWFLIKAAHLFQLSQLCDSNLDEL